MRAAVFLTSIAWASAARVHFESDVVSFERPSWTQGRRAASRDVIDVTFVVKPTPDAIAALESTFWEVSDPFSPRYKDYLSLDEAAELLHPTFSQVSDVNGGRSLSDAAKVVDYLVSQPGLMAGSLDVTLSRGFVTASLYAGAAEKLFDTELYHYAPRHSSSFEELGHRFEGLFASSHIRAAKPYSLPEELASHVSLVDKLLRLPRLSSPPAAPPPVPRDSPITPAVAAAARAAAGAAAEVASSAAAAAAAAVQEVQEEAEGAMNVVLPRRRLGLGTSRSTRSDCTLGSANCTTTATINEDEEEEEEEDPFVQCTGAAPACKDATTPAVLRARYGFPQLNSSTPGNSMGCTEFQLQGIKKQDLDDFAQACQLEHVEVDRVKGLGGRLIPGVEALLDVEYIEAVAAPIPLTVINSVTYSLLDWATNLASDRRPAWVQSVSYGNDEVQQVSKEYMDACNVQFLLCGVRGLSVLFASGDQGVWGRSGHVDNVFHPDFPAGSPYITAVGGTDFVTKSKLGAEKAWTYSGGGFSNHFNQPPYQAKAVASYLDSASVHLPDARLFNESGRGYPDLSALAGQQNGYCVAYKGEYLKVGGTSASTPVVAGAIALLNDELLAAGKPPMGFLNPWIYGVAAPAGAFFDVESGTNNGGLGSGFEATSGWDPATGCGTPNYPALRALVMG